MEIYDINMVVIIDIDIWNKVDLVVIQKAIRPPSYSFLII
jgi:hypothetical protein